MARHPIDTAGQPVWSKLRPHQGVQRRSPAAPRSATASVDENASADQYLRDAQTALRERRIREAREALERAEIRVLNSAPNTNAGKNSTVDTIEQAREALGHVRYLRPDLARGGQMIDQAMSETASKGTSSLSGGQSGSTNGSAGPTPHLAREIEKMRLARMPVELRKEKDQNAVSYFQVRLVEKPDLPVGDIFSEGEHRCVALAAFLAELVTSKRGSGIVFDDPMSSLDHIHRRAIAARLAEEAAHRQVIVFTHDLAFLFGFCQIPRRPGTGRRRELSSVGSGLTWSGQSNRCSA